MICILVYNTDRLSKLAFVSHRRYLNINLSILEIHNNLYRFCFFFIIQFMLKLLKKCWILLRYFHWTETQRLLNSNIYLNSFFFLFSFFDINTQTRDISFNWFTLRVFMRESEVKVMMAPGGRNDCWKSIVVFSLQSRNLNDRPVGIMMSLASEGELASCNMSLVGLSWNKITVPRITINY